MRKKILILMLLGLSFCGLCLADIERVETLLLNGDLSAAEQHCQELLGGNPAKSVEEQALFYLATINLKQNRYADCRHNFNILIQNFPDSSLLNRARLGVADSYAAERNYSLAEKIYAELLAGKDEAVAPAVYAHLVDLYIKEGERGKAQDYLSRLQNKYPLSFEAGSIKRLPETAVAEEPQETPVPVSSPAETQAVQPVTPAETNKDFFTVQVGAFSDHARANKLYQELIARGEDAFLVLLETPSGESLYRVRVGKLPFRQEAEGLARKLSGQGYPTKIIP
jgi:TolA-binding protein